MQKIRVVAAMSGGVDSSVAAALLQKQGYEVIGLTMCFNLFESLKKKPICCGAQGIEDARRIAHSLGIRHYVLNMRKALDDYVIRDFCAEYILGRTPNPCVRCNQYLKFGLLLKKALALGAEYLATGHYARICRNRKTKTGKQIYLLRKAKDKFKDQSYFLYRLTHAQLKHTLFPLGNYTKKEVRLLAGRFDLAVADKPASQEICFLPEAGYREFLRQRSTGGEARTTKEIRPALVVDKQGKVIGRHQGTAFYTIGQREGLGIALGYPAYIINIDARANLITIGRREDAYKSELLLKEPHFSLRLPKKKVVFKVKIRYNHQQAPAEVQAYKGRVRVRFKDPQFALTPGQSAVFYDSDRVIGGGIIDRVLR